MAKKRDLSIPLNVVTFRCDDCEHNFDAVPARVVDCLELVHHPFEYYGICPTCDTEVPQAAHHRNLLKAWANATGPRTALGKAATAQNLAGHPTPEEALRTRFNAMKHGLTAQVAQYFPARPDKYPACSQCEVDRDFCAAQPACVKQTELFMLHHAAFEQKDPKVLQPIFANMQASITALVQQIIQTIIADGVKLEAPAWAINNKTGDIVIGEYVDAEGNMRTIMEVKAHPLIKSLQEFLSRNNMALSDLGMTPKMIEKEDEGVSGRFGSADETRTLDMDEYMRQQAESMSKLRELTERARLKKETDPVLLEYRNQNGSEEVSA